MKKISEYLTDYVIRKGMVNKEDRTIYEYGFTIAIELGIYIIFCLIISVYLHMIVEGILFFIIFSPLRLYAGGLHLKNSWSCFILSCLTFSVILVATNYIQLPVTVSFCLLLLLELAVYSIYPIENVNRTVDEDENKYFKNKLVRFLGFDIIIGVIFLITQNATYLQELVFIFAIVVFTMISGKYVNNKMNISHKVK